MNEFKICLILGRGFSEHELEIKLEENSGGIISKEREEFYGTHLFTNYIIKVEDAKEFEQKIKSYVDKVAIDFFHRTHVGYGP